MDWFHITYAIINVALMVSNIMMAKLLFKADKPVAGTLGILLAIVCFFVVVASAAYAFSGGK